MSRIASGGVLDIVLPTFDEEIEYLTATAIRFLLGFDTSDLNSVGTYSS